jgi:hypothetical protein
VDNQNSNKEKRFVACVRSDITTVMAIRIATVDMAVKCRLNSRKHFV